MEGEKYKEIKTILILFNDFRNEKIPELLMANLKLQDKENGYVKNEIESYEFYLPNYHKESYNEIEEEMDKRLWIMGAKDIEELKENVNEIDENFKIVRAYEELLEKHPIYGYYKNVKKEEEKEKRTLEAWAREDGIKEGAHAQAIKTAKGLLSMGIASIKQIAEVTNLSIEEIEELKEN